MIVAASLCLFWWLRRKKVRKGGSESCLTGQRRDLARLEDLADRARKGESSAFHLSQPGSPVTSRHHSTQTGLARSPPTSNGGSRTSSQRLPNAPVEAEYRDANGNTIRVYAGKRGAINADPNHPDNGGSGDPFGDHASLSTDRAESGHSTNVIPIQYVPGQDVAAARSGLQANASQQAAAARTLDQARQNLWRPRTAVPPPRPARAPDLDLRLNSLQQQEHNQLLLMSEDGSSRDSFRSGISVTPSFLSGATADLHLDVPKIMTRQAVQVGRLQAAEMVQFGVPQPVSFGAQPAVSEETTSSIGSDPFTEHSAELLNPTPAGGTFGVSGPHTGGVAAQSNISLGSRAFDDEGNVSQPSPTDLRFSMGSLAYDRASVSTQGTIHRAQFLSPQDQPPVPSIPAGYDRPRFQSMSSYKSTGNDSLLGSFPMIPPASGSANASNTDLNSAQPGAAPPPTAFKAAPGAGAGAARPLTATSAHSLADSFLGRFPFVPPNVDADGSSRGSEQAHASRLTLGMSNVSGLGGFEFSFDRSGSAAGGPSGEEQPPMHTGSSRHTQAPAAAGAASAAAPPSPAPASKH